MVHGRRSVQTVSVMTMALLTLRDIQLSYGGPALLDGVNLSIERGERIGLVGRNGVGKSSLMRLVTGAQKPDSGEIEAMPRLRVAQLEQDLPPQLGGRIFDIAASGFGALGRDAGILHRDALRADEVANPAEAWALVPKIETILSRLSLDADAEFDVQSGGIKRRALLAKALVSEPDLLLLDEPTNHLDIPAVEWLEGFLKSAGLTLLFVTHDRAFLQSVATRIAEIDRGKMLSWECDYRTYLERRAQFLADEAAENARFDKRLAEEEAWSRQNVQARRTKSVARMKEVERMRAQRAERRSLLKSAKMNISEAERSGKLVVEAEGIAHAWEPGKPLVQGLDITVLRGDRIGLIGPNGCGKTTLAKILLGEVAPNAGKVRVGTNVEVVYFDQAREQLDPDATVADTVADGNDHVTVGGRQRHIVGYLKDFLFEAPRARSRVGVLSGGEKSRVLLAKLFLRPSNVLVLDEPTNDLDIETLELLEERVLDYEGTVIVVSHDRAFLNAVCTNVLVFEDGNVEEFVGGYDDWLRQRTPPASKSGAKTDAGKASAVARPAKPATRKLSFKEKREIEALPAQLEALETEQAALEARLADPDLYADAEAVRTTTARYEAVQEEWVAAYARWEELEALSGEG